MAGGGPRMGVARAFCIAQATGTGSSAMSLACARIDPGGEQWQKPMPSSACRM